MGEAGCLYYWDYEVLRVGEGHGGGPLPLWPAPSHRPALCQPAEDKPKGAQARRNEHTHTSSVPR